MYLWIFSYWKPPTLVGQGNAKSVSPSALCCKWSAWPPEETRRQRGQHPSWVMTRGRWSGFGLRAQAKGRGLFRLAVITRARRRERSLHSSWRAWPWRRQTSLIIKLCGSKAKGKRMLAFRCLYWKSPEPSSCPKSIQALYGSWSALPSSRSLAVPAQRQH